MTYFTQKIVQELKKRQAEMLKDAEKIEITTAEELEARLVGAYEEAKKRVVA